MTLLSQLHRHKGTLEFARGMLTLCIVLQLPFVIQILLRQGDLLFHLNILGDKQMPTKINWLLNGATSILAIVGFTMVCRQLSLWEGNLEETELVRRTRVLGTAKIAVSVQLFFYLVFLVPVFNLVPVLWARSKASGAIRDLEQLMPARRRR